MKMKEVAQLFNNRTLWAIYPGQYCITALTNPFMIWCALYLSKERGMTIMEAG